MSSVKARFVDLNVENMQKKRVRENEQCKKYSELKDFLRAQFVDFTCQKYVKIEYIEITETIYLEPRKSVLGRSTLHF